MTPPVTTPLVRLLAKIEKHDADCPCCGGCWLWTGSLNAGGYGRFYMDASRPHVVAHKAAYELLVGPVPAGLTLDHVAARGCRHRSCVNPEHLEPVSMRENLSRSERAPATVNAAKTHCKRGHPFDDANTYIYSDGRRGCRQCIRDAARERMRRVRQEAVAA